MSDDRARFEAMFTQHYAHVARYALRRVGERGAHEVVAETFLAAWRRLDEVPDNALPWLYGTARRLVANELRRRSRALRLGQRIEAEPAAASDDPADVIPERLLVQAALATLSERDQEVLRLSEWEQLTPAEGALAMGCSAAAFKVRLHRARRRFAQAIGDDARSPRPIVSGGEIA